MKSTSKMFTSLTTFKFLPLLLLLTPTLTTSLSIPPSKRISISSKTKSSSWTPITTSPAVNDSDVLNFALTLEHLENAFYTQGLANFSEEAFSDAGYDEGVRGRYVEISEHEATHVKFLEMTLEGLGAKAVEPCTYDFSGSTDPKSFVAMSAAFETVGTSAYSGAAQLITSKQILTNAAEIQATEARQSSWIQSFVQKANPWSGSFEVALTADEVFTIAQTFIVSCPSTNPPLIATPFQSLGILPSTPQPGQTVTLTFDVPSVLGDDPLFVAFLNSNSTEPEFVSLQQGQKTVTLPDTLRGTVFVVISTSNSEVNDQTVVAGPAPLMFPFDADGKLIQT